MSLIDKIPWQNVQHLWINNELRYQWLSLLVVIFFSTLLSAFLGKLYKTRFLSDAEETKHQILKTSLLRLIAPSVFLILTVLCLSGFRSLNLDTADFIKPAFNVSVAWIAYRLFGVFTNNRTWLRTIAVFLFGLAALSLIHI